MINLFTGNVVLFDISVGSEFDFVIFSTVRSMPHRSIRSKAAVQADRTWIREHLGFITDRHQICVGITRAKHGLVIVGEFSHSHNNSRAVIHIAGKICEAEFLRRYIFSALK